MIFTVIPSLFLAGLASFPRNRAGYDAPQEKEQEKECLAYEPTDVRGAE
jgi:hypothetical protein